MATFIKPCNGYLNSFYGPRIHPITGVKGTFHRGIDYTGASDESIFAAAAGKVRFVDTSPTRTGFGKYIIITHDNGFETVYAHLSVVSVKVGQRVSQGQKIGVKGTTGNSTGIHLHFEMSKGRWNNKYTTNVDPLPFIDDPEIRTVQSVLKELNLYQGAIDGIHGTKSQAAVKAFQKKNGLGADGVPGRGTMALILKEKANLVKPQPVVKPSASKPVKKGYLSYGDRSEEVTALKENLNQLGFSVEIGNYYNTETKKAVMTFQEKRGLKADGIYGKDTASEMTKALKEKEVEKLELTAEQRKELAGIFKKAREAGVFSSAEHEKTIIDGSMSMSRLLYLQSVIAGAALNNGDRV